MTTANDHWGWQKLPGSAMVTMTYKELGELMDLRHDIRIDFVARNANDHKVFDIYLLGSDLPDNGLYLPVERSKIKEEA